MAELRAPDLVCDGQPMIRERVGDEGEGTDEEDSQYVYDLYTAVDGDAGQMPGCGLPMVRLLLCHFWASVHPRQFE